MFVFIVIYLKVVIIIASTIIYVTKSAQFSQWFLFFFLFIHYKKSSLHFVQKWRIISNEYDISVSLKKKPFKTRARFQYPQIQKRSLSIIHAFFSFFRFFLKLNYPYENSTPSFYIYIYIDKYCNKISSYQNLNRINSLPLFVSHHRR